VKKSKSANKRTSAKATSRNKAAKPLRDLKVTKAAGVRGGMTATEDYGTTDMVML
jgi:hypothetical protein